VTVNEHGSDVLPNASLAVHVTVVVPFGKLEPEAGEQFAVHVSFCLGRGFKPPPVAQGQSGSAAKLTTAEHMFGSVF
jgi:hypothetical protein